MCNPVMSCDSTLNIAMHTIPDCLIFPAYTALLFYLRDLSSTQFSKASRFAAGRGMLVVPHELHIYLSILTS
jgi:hypothetical protein